MNIKSRFFTKDENKVFQEMRINPHILKTFPTAKGSDLLICWSQASTEAFQNLRINPQILKTPPKAPWVEFIIKVLGEKLKKSQPNFFCGFVIPIKNTFCKKNGKKRSILPPAVP